MVMKEADELPFYLTRIPEYTPTPREKVIVLAIEGDQFMRVRLSGNKAVKECVLSQTYFRTVRNDTLREQLKVKPRTPGIDKLIKAL